MLKSISNMQKTCVLVLAVAGTTAGCVAPPAGSGEFAGFRDSFGGGLGGNELYRYMANGSVFIDWSDGYAECGYFGGDGWYEYDTFHDNYGYYYYDNSYGEPWSVNGNQVCFSDDCFNASWRGNGIHLTSTSQGYTGYAEVYDGSGYYYYDSCGIG